MRTAVPDPAGKVANMTASAEEPGRPERPTGSEDRQAAEGGRKPRRRMNYGEGLEAPENDG